MQEQKTVAVTAQHITRGVRADCSCCPLALAASDAFPGKLCIATWGRIYVYPGTHRDYIENGAWFVGARWDAADKVDSAFPL
jgi:hypothetical protein